MRPVRSRRPKLSPHALRWGATIAIVWGDGKQGAGALALL